jgi:hypothetical protein
MMVGKYKTTKTIRGIEAIQLREDNIMDVADFLGCNNFYSYKEEEEDGYIIGVDFIVDGDEYLLKFDNYIALNIDGYEIYSEKDFNSMFERDCDE